MTGVACIGAAHVDRTVRCHEAFAWRASNPVAMAMSPGGAARNVALNLSRLGQRVKLVSVIGDDPEGEMISRELRAAGIDLSDVECLGQQATASYTAVLDRDGELLCGLAAADIYARLGAAQLKALAPGLAAWPLWAIDANLPAEGIGALAALVPEGVRLAALAVSPAKAPRLAPHLAHFDMLFANRAEAAALLGRKVETVAEALAAGTELRALGPDQVFVTLGANGVAVSAPGHSGVTPALGCDVVSVNGAGDAFAAGVIDALLAEAPLTQAIGIGLAAASLTAASPDTCSAKLGAS